MPSNHLEIKKTADTDGEMVIGVTTDPEVFMNAPIDDSEPFVNRIGISEYHGIFRTNGWISFGDGGGINAFGGPLIEGLTMDIWIGVIESFGDRDECVNIFKVAQSGTILKKDDERDMLGYKLKEDENGNLLDYYLAIGWTVTNKKIVKFELSGDFVQ